jgi:ribosomal protein L1
MNEDNFNMEIRKFLKKVGVTSQREIEHAVYKAIESGNIKGKETMKIKMTLSLPEVNLEYSIEGEIALE